MSETAIFLQARMGSQRLPQKVLKNIAGKPMIQWIIEKLTQLNDLAKLIVLTSESNQDDVLADYLAEKNIPCFRGSELDVLDRYYQCAKLFKVKNIIRATADNPFTDIPAAIELVDIFLKNDLDYACAFPEFDSGYPIGTGLEIMRFDSLEISWQEGHLPHHREHVNEYIQENLDKFRHSILKTNKYESIAALRLTVDTAEDFSFAEKLFQYYIEKEKDSPVYMNLDWILENYKA